MHEERPTMMSSKDAPLILYKYRSWKNDFHRRMLSHHEVFFAAPSTLNDPCEFAALPEFSECSDEKAHEYFKEFLTRTKPHRTEQEIVDELHALGTKWWQNPETRKRHDRLMIDYSDSRFAVFSCARTPDNDIMWALYADGDRGFCVGFDTARFLEEFVDESKPSISLDSVEYMEDVPRLNVYELGDDAVRRWRLIKSKIWEHEKELRLLLNQHPRDHFRLPGECFAEVTMGSRMAPHERDQLKCTLRSWPNRPRLFVRDRKLRSFDFTRREIFY